MLLQKHLFESLFELQKNIENILQSITPNFIEVMEHITFEDSFSKIELGTIFLKMKELSLDIDYLKKTVKMEGVLKRNLKGNIYIDDVKLRPMEVIEVWIYVETLKEYCWVKTYIVGDKINYLAGINMLKRLTGIKARKRNVILSV